MVNKLSHSVFYSQWTEQALIHLWETAEESYSKRLLSVIIYRGSRKRDHTKLRNKIYNYYTKRGAQISQETFFHRIENLGRFEYNDGLISLISGSHRLHDVLSLMDLLSLGQLYISYERGTDPEHFLQQLSLLRDLPFHLLTHEEFADGFLDKLAETIIKYNLQVVELSLSLHKGVIYESDISGLARILQENKSLQELSLHCTKIGDKGVKKLAQALQMNSSLQKLDLTYNKITDEGAKELGNALLVNHSLRDLILMSNKITDEGAKALAQALQKRSIPTRLDMRCTDIEKEGYYALKTSSGVWGLLSDLSYLGDYNAKHFHFSMN